MKKTIYLSLIASLFTTLVSAADLYVRDLGDGGAYPTITAAINAAADGDRIIIRRKAVGSSYVENLVINKSLTFISENNFEKYLVQGTVSITPLAGRVVSINNIQLLSNITVSTDTTGGRTTLNVMNCIVNSVSADFINTTLNISGCVVPNISLRHGKVTGNSCSIISSGSGSIETNPSTDDIEIIANKITSSSSNAITINQENYNFKILNNYIVGNVSINTRLKNSGTNEISNNVVIGYPNTSSISIFNISAPNALTKIFNNVIKFNTGTFEISVTSSIANVYNNMCEASLTISGSGAANQAQNTSNASLTYNDNTYTVSGANVNAGLPTDDFRDLDLSLNDVGNFGGSNSWANYWPTAVGNKPQINYLNTPRKILSGTTTITAKASGYSK